MNHRVAIEILSLDACRSNGVEELDLHDVENDGPKYNSGWKMQKFENDWDLVRHLPGPAFSVAGIRTRN